MTTASWRNRGHAAYWAFLVHRVSGLALAVFLPLHFLALAQALRSEAALEGFLRWTRAPLVEASEILLVFLLAAHLTGGLRILFVEFVGWRSEAQKALLAAAGGVALFCAVAFALNLARA
jgi:fumarate reductase subunit D